MEIGLIIVSDKGFSNERVDRTGPKMLEYFASKGYGSYFKLVPDIQGIISDVIKEFSEIKEIDLIITAGGTGCTDRDVTPEATIDVVEKIIPGISELIRYKSSEITLNAFLSRGVSGIINKKVVINLPGSPDGAYQTFKIVEPILEHLIDQVQNGSKDHK
ncbi:MAG: hypothetical protein A2015_06790 [Spirochaetes bacterium GWF1_31_7]|nr:MAG: hypothetical protein A2Y30_09670 [Spirochaetes bacterium GWE1_32_154]OHD46538.1 MAG: hypothetical protein A2015_06790 [Spirochaetes bacterium GWF1_31_7]OHD49347.1 MAG: hypothetical protein A2Y29_03785 [Spirochaetes bacterium GWE2_31_10]OHD77186.1 MAG: hypothetical protein A2355_02685 [Spirochaetes bacterium RIFOXYB1_FULL_32_8]HBD93086.1 molybdenum cofactor biosynthesis protein [Spirochaetia bacterium]